MRAAGEGGRQEVAAAALCLAYGAVLHRAMPRAVYVPANVSAAGLSILLARRCGATWDDMGTRPDRLAGGLRLGLLSAVPLAAAAAVGVAVPATRRLFLDERVVASSDVLSKVLVRIPIGTALGEEVIFRGALLGLFLRRHGPVAATVLTSAVFGLWHVLPGLDQVRTNPAGAYVAGDHVKTAGWGAGTILVSGVAGLALAWLRLRSGSVLAPVIAHAAANGFGFLGGRLAYFLGR